MDAKQAFAGRHNVCSRASLILAQDEPTIATDAVEPEVFVSVVHKLLVCLPYFAGVVWC